MEVTIDMKSLNFQITMVFNYDARKEDWITYEIYLNSN
jgi:hypothetical protein